MQGSLELKATLAKTSKSTSGGLGRTARRNWERQTDTLPSSQQHPQEQPKAHGKTMSVSTWWDTSQPQKERKPSMC